MISISDRRKFDLTNFAQWLVKLYAGLGHKTYIDRFKWSNMILEFTNFDKYIAKLFCITFLMVKYVYHF